MSGLSTSAARTEPAEEQGLQLIDAGLPQSREMGEKILHSYSSVSKYEDSQWVIDARETNMNYQKDRVLDFTKLQDSHPLLCNDLKDWALGAVMHRKVKSLRATINTIKWALSVISEDKTISQLTRKDIMDIYDHLRAHSSESTMAHTWGCLYNFFHESGCIRVTGYMDQYIVHVPQPHKVDEKYIPLEEVRQLDLIFSEEILPVSMRATYWILRMYPNRIEEALSIKRDALKPYTDNSYILSIPVNKSAFGREEPFERLFRILNEGEGAMLISLLQKQEQYLDSMGADTQFLLDDRRFAINRKNGSITYEWTSEDMRPMTAKRVNMALRTLCELLGFKDAHGNQYIVTSHMLRHNSVTDRLESGIFKPIDVQQETGHANTLMIERNYYHPHLHEEPVKFRGLVASDRDLTAMLIDHPYAHKLPDAGLCADISGCSKDLYACLTCEHLTPDPKKLSYMKAELREWKEKQKQAEKVQNTTFAELCDKWVLGYQCAIEKIQKLKKGDKEHAK